MVAVLLGVTPALAEEECLTMMNIGRNIGWIQATCSLYRLGQLRPDVAEMTIAASMKELASVNPSMKALVEKTVLEKNPACSNVWPRYIS
jgi:hypothetical protein